jgi:hypothetical protein
MGIIRNVGPIFLQMFIIKERMIINFDYILRTYLSENDIKGILLNKKMDMNASRFL